MKILKIFLIQMQTFYFEGYEDNFIHFNIVIN